MRFRKAIRTLVLLGAGVVGFSVASCGSNDDRCTEACDYWSTCETWGASCWNPPFDECYDKCLAEDDWDATYLRCLRKRSGACCAMAEDC
jgi:hypothetical protein